MGTKTNGAIPEGWYEPDEELHRQEMVEELQEEVGEGHVLKGLNVRLVARYRGTDDALFALDDGRIAQVHLTWSDEMETDPRFPATRVFPSFEAWLSFWNSL
jgi:hypothetical protein